jgi:hypothetical protein
VNPGLDNHQCLPQGAISICAFDAVMNRSGVPRRALALIVHLPCGFA